jgi:DNA-binding response OmpR family regulator
MPHSILICEDDTVLAEALRAHLEARGYRVAACREGATALRLLEDGTYSLLVLDLMLPDMDGFDVCRRMRKSCQIPVLMVSGRRGEVDRIVGLEIGADDYLEKPFGCRELVARIDAHLRRTESYTSRGPAGPTIDLGRLQLDPDSHQVLKDGQPVHLTPKEYSLLQVLVENRGSVSRTAHLLLRVWGYDSAIRTRTLDVHIGRLRAKLEPRPHHPQYIITVPGVGYKLCVAEGSSQAA